MIKTHVATRHSNGIAPDVIQVTDRKRWGAMNDQDRETRSDRWERQMSYLENVVNERPMLRVATSVILAFCFALPLVWLFSNLVVYGLRSVL
jgi:hypothetical protein